MKRASKTLKRLIFFVFLLIILVSALIINLKNGIRVENFITKHITISELYIKLDKKIILQIQNLQIQSNEESDFSLGELKKFISLILSLFEEINISGQISNQDLNIFFKNNNLIINTPDILFIADIYDKGRVVNLQITEFSLKNFDLHFKGESDANFFADKYVLLGEFSSYELKGKLKANLKRDILDFEIYDVSAKTIKNFISNLAKAVDLSNEVRNWIYGYIIADDYKLAKFKGNINIKSQKYIPKMFVGEAYAKNLSIKFHENVPPVKVKSAKITLEDDVLGFKLYEPIWEGKNISGSEVFIDRLTQNRTNINVLIRSSSMLDSKINDILKAYEIDFGLEQKSGKLQTDLALKIFPLPFKIEVAGKFDLKDANLNFGDFPLSVDKSEVILSNDKVIVSQSNIKNQILNANLSADINLNKLNANLKGNLNKICVGGNKCEVLNIPKQQATLTIDFSKNIKFDAPKIKFKAEITKNGFEIESVKDLKKYSNLMKQLNILDSKIIINSNKNANTINLKNLKFDLGLFDLNGNAYKKDDFSIVVADNIIGKSKTNFIGFKIDDKSTHINLADLQINLDSSDIGSNLDKTIVYGSNLTFNIKDFEKELDFDECEIRFGQNGMNFMGKFEDSVFRYNKSKNNQIAIEGANLNSYFINQILGSDSFNDGVFDAKIIGSSLDDMKIMLKFTDSYLADFRFYQNLFAFINTIPSISTLSMPKFNLKGFHIKDGYLIADKKQDQIDISALFLRGDSADILAQGEVNLQSKIINIDMELSYLKDATRLIKNLPLINYILLGKDKKITTAIKITGSIDNPEFKTQIAGDLINIPFNMLKNIIELPKNLLSE